MGFNNGGSAAAAERLAVPRDTRVGVNLGKSKVVAEEDVLSDYVLSAERLAPLARLRGGQRELPEHTRAAQPAGRGEAAAAAGGGARGHLSRPRLLAHTARAPAGDISAPDLADEDVDQVADLAVQLGLDGIIATNTTISRVGLRSHPARVEACGAGGLSGAPLEARSLAVLKRLRARVGPDMTLVAVGGVETPEHAYARIRAGATLIQVYTGLIYHGPMLPKRLARGLERLARRDGFERVADAVGVDA